MARTSRRTAFLLALAAVAAFAQHKAAVKPASEYAAKQSQAGVTIAVKAYHTKEAVQEAFGKADPVKYGILPVLLVVENGGKESLSLENLEVRYITSRGDGVDAVPAEDLGLWNPKGHQPRDRPRYIPPVPGLNRPKVKKGPLAKSEITGSGFSAPLLVPGESANGFFYYNVGDVENSTDNTRIYISGLKNMATGQELFYFEVPLQ